MSVRGSVQRTFCRSAALGDRVVSGKALNRDNPRARVVATAPFEIGELHDSRWQYKKVSAHSFVFMEDLCKACWETIDSSFRSSGT